MKQKIIPFRERQEIKIPIELLYDEPDIKSLWDIVDFNPPDPENWILTTMYDDCTATYYISARRLNETK